MPPNAEAVAGGAIGKAEDIVGATKVVLCDVCTAAARTWARACAVLRRTSPRAMRGCACERRSRGRRTAFTGHGRWPGVQLGEGPDRGCCGDRRRCLLARGAGPLRLPVELLHGARCAGARCEAEDGSAHARWQSRACGRAVHAGRAHMPALQDGSRACCQRAWVPRSSQRRTLVPHQGWDHPGGDQIKLFGGNDVTVQVRCLHACGVRTFF